MKKISYELDQVNDLLKSSLLVNNIGVKKLITNWTVDDSGIVLKSDFSFMFFIQDCFD